MADAQDLISEEAEALQTLYTDLDFCSAAQPFSVTLEVAPVLQFHSDQTFVRLTLLLQFPQCYPAEPPSVTVASSKGEASFDSDSR